VEVSGQWAAGRAHDRQLVARRRIARYAAPAPTSPTRPSPASRVAGEPESVESPRAAAALAPSPVEAVGGVVSEVVGVGGVVVAVLPGAVVVGVAPGLLTEPDVELLPAADVGPGEALVLLGRAGPVPTGVGLGLGFGAGGRLDEDDGLGFGDGLGAAAPGGGLLGAPPEPKAKPMTLPGAGSYSATPALL